MRKVTIRRLNSAGKTTGRPLIDLPPPRRNCKDRPPTITH